jgi:hypothetical protein
MVDEEVIARAKASIDVIIPHAVPPESKYKRKDKATLT